MTPAPLHFALPDRISVTEENALLTFLRDTPDAPVDVSAAGLRRADTLLVQTLIAAAADRRARGIGFRLVDVPPGPAAQLAALGVTDTLLDIQVSA